MKTLPAPSSASTSSDCPALRTGLSQGGTQQTHDRSKDIPPGFELLLVSNLFKRNKRLRKYLSVIMRKLHLAVLAPTKEPKMKILRNSDVTPRCAFSRTRGLELAFVAFFRSDTQPLTFYTNRIPAFVSNCFPSVGHFCRE